MAQSTYRILRLTSTLSSPQRQLHTCIRKVAAISVHVEQLAILQRAQSTVPEDDWEHCGLQHLRILLRVKEGSNVLVYFLLKQLEQSAARALDRPAILIFIYQEGGV